MQIKTYPGDDRYKVCENGDIIGPLKVLKQSLHPTGYLYVAIGRNTRKAHRVICETFLPNPEKKPQVNHKNGIKTDNRISNLEWSTRSENMAHAFKTGLKSHIGDKNTRNKIPKDHIAIIREAVMLGYNPKLIAIYYGVHKNTIYQIKYNVNWSHI